MPLFPSFKVMMEFANLHSGVSEHALHFLQSGSTQLKGKDKEKKKKLAQSLASRRCDSHMQMC